MTLPVYIKIHNDIRNKVETGQWKVGSRIPSERKLANDYGVSRMTFRQAVQVLVDDGILKRVPGSGTFVTNQKVQEQMSKISSFTDTMIKQGKVPSSKTVSYQFVEPTFQEAKMLGLNQNDRVLRMKRIRYGDKVPICLETATINEKIITGLTKDDVTSSFYASLRNKRNLQPKYAKQLISANVATSELGNLLDIKTGEPVLELKQTSYLVNGKPFEYVRAQYAAERFEFYLKK